MRSRFFTPHPLRDGLVHVANGFANLPGFVKPPENLIHGFCHGFQHSFSRAVHNECDFVARMQVQRLSHRLWYRDLPFACNCRNNHF